MLKRLILSSCLLHIFARADHLDWKDLIIPAIPRLNYTEVSEQCAVDTKLWLSSLQMFILSSEQCMATGKCDTKTIEDNLFAVQQLDAFGRLWEPGLLELQTTFDGNYQECARISGIKYKTNYCYMSLVTKKKVPKISPLPYRSAVCMPRSCKHNDLPILYNQLESKIFDAVAAFCVHRDVEKGSAFWGFSAFMIVMAAIAILATSVDFLRETVYGIQSEKEKNTILKLLLAFSFWTNAGQVLSVKEQKPGFIKSLDCIRAFSMSWVIAGHTLMYFEFGDTLLPVVSVRKHLWNHLFLNGFLSVDTFFLLSGIVVAYLFFKQRPKKQTVKSPLTWSLFYLHRYLRLTPPYMLFVGFFVVYGPYIQGPYAAFMWNFFVRQTDGCKNKWWRNLLYINNFDTDQTSTCYGISWYLAVDTQFYFLAPIVLILFYFSFAAGAITIVAGCVGSIVTTYILYGIYDMPADPYSDDPSGEFTNVLYQRPWIRCTPYLVGLLTGYIIATYGKRQIRLNWALSILFWLIAFGIAFACLFSNYDYDKGSVWSSFSKATFHSFSRLGWAIAVAWVITANHFGWGGPINAFMSHPIWQPFGKLSYCAYIVHWVVLYYYLNIGERPLRFYNVWQVYIGYAVPATALAYVVAFFWSCLFEVSTLKLEKMLIESIMKVDTKNKSEVGEARKSKVENSWEIDMDSGNSS